MNLNPNLDVNDPEKNAIWELGQEGGRTRLINKDILYDNLVDVHHVFSQFKIKHWLSHGTMLGVYRNGDFISYDDDADVGADSSFREIGILAEAELRRKGFYVPEFGDPKKPINPRNNMPYSDTVAIRNGEKVEIWWFTKIGNKYVYDIYRQPPELIHDSKYYDTLDLINFRERLFPCPSNTEEWIKMMYGQDWKTPIEGVKYNNSHGRQR